MMEVKHLLKTLHRKLLLSTLKVKIVVYSPDIHDYAFSTDFTFLLAIQGGRQCSLELLIQPWICAPGADYDWVDRGSVEYEVCLTFPHMI